MMYTIQLQKIIILLPIKFQMNLPLKLHGT